MQRLTKPGRALVTKLAALGAMQAEIAATLGINVQAWNALKERDTDAQEAFDLGRAQFASRQIGRMEKLAEDGHFTAMAYLLNNVCGFRAGETPEGPRRQQVQINIEIPAALDPDVIRGMAMPKPEEQK